MASWLLIMSGGGMPLLSLTQGFGSASTSGGAADVKAVGGGSDAKGGSAPAPASAPSAAGAESVNPYQFAHAGTAFTLHTGANNADFAMSYVLADRKRTASGSASSAATGEADAALAYRSYDRDNLLIVWSSSETDLMTVGGTDCAAGLPGGRSKFAVRIDSMYDACVMGIGAAALFNSRTDIPKKQLRVRHSFAGLCPSLPDWSSLTSSSAALLLSAA
jgi:hypothetical protein